MPGWSGPDPAPGDIARPRRPPGLAGALVLLAVWIAATGVGLLSDKPGQILAPLPQVLATALLLAAIAWFRWSDVGLGAPVPGTARLMVLPWLYLVGYAATILTLGGIDPDLLLGLAAVLIWVGISEELMFRGLLYPALRRRLGPWPAIWLTSLAFGAVHLGNGARSGDFEAAIVQSLAAVSTGLLLLALRLRRGSIWPAIVYHSLWNLGAFGLDLTGGASAPLGAWLDSGDLWRRLAVTLGFVAPNGLYGLWLMRRAGRERLPGDVAGPEGP